MSKKSSDVNERLRRRNEEMDSLRCTFMILRHKLARLGATHATIDVEENVAEIEFRSSYSLELDNEE